MNIEAVNQLSSLILPSSINNGDDAVANNVSDNSSIQNNISTALNLVQSSSNDTSINNVSSGNQALAGFGLGLGAIAAFLVPQIIADLNTRKELTKAEKTFLDQIFNVKGVYSKTEIKALAKRSEALLKFLTDDPVAAKKWLETLDIVKYAKKYHPNHEINYPEFIDNLYKKLVLKTSQILLGKVEHIYFDNDGTMEFKDFANVVSGADQAVFDAIRLSQQFNVALGAKERGMYKLYIDGDLKKGETLGNLSEKQIFNRLIDAGFYTYGKGSINSSEVRKFLNIWLENISKTHKIPSKENLEYFEISPIFYFNTARNGVENNYSIIAAPPNEVFGVGVSDSETNRSPDTFGNTYQSLGFTNQPNSKLPYFLTGAIGMSGRVLDGPLFLVNSAMLKLYANDIQGKFAKMGLPEKFDEQAFRVVEQKGFLTNLNLGYLRDYYSWKIVEREKNQGHSVPSQTQINKEIQNIFNTGEFTLANGKKEKIDANVLYVWSRKVLKELSVKLYEANTDWIKNKDPEAARTSLKKLRDIIRPINDEEYEVLDMKRKYAKDGEIIHNKEKMEKSLQLTEDLTDGKSKLPLPQEYIDKLDSLLRKDNLRIKDIEDFSREIREIHILTMTNHTITHRLDGVFETKDGVDKMFNVSKRLKSILKNKDEKYLFVLESGKANYIGTLMKALESNRALEKEILDALGKEDMIRINMGPTKVNEDKTKDQCVFNVVNNSKDSTEGEYLVILDKSKASEIIKDPSKKVHLPYSAYLEVSMIALDKEGALPALRDFINLYHFGGDSVGSDSYAITMNLLVNPLAQGTISRKMIQDFDAIDRLFKQLDINSSKYGAARRKQIRKDAEAAGLDEVRTNDLVEFVDKQIKSNPLAYEVIEKNKDINKQKYRLVGTGADKLFDKLEFTGERNLKEALRGHINDLFLNRVTRADDVPQNHLLHLIQNAIVHGHVKDGKISGFSGTDISELIVNNKLSGAALDHLGAKDRIAFSLGMPPESNYSPKDWELKFHDTKRNVYSFGHLSWLNTLPAYLTTAQAGGLLMALAGMGLGALKIFGKDKKNSGSEKDSSEDLFALPDLAQPNKLQFSSQSNSNNLIDSSLLSSLSLDSNGSVANSSALPPNKPPETIANPSNLASLSITALNTGIVLQNVGLLMQNLFMSVFPQPLSILGAGVNLSTFLLPENMRLPTFVLGSALSMGGWALKQSQFDRADVNPLMAGDPKNYKKAVEGSKWNSFDLIPHPTYSRTGKDGKKIGYAHAMYPGFIANLDRSKYYQRYEKWTKQGMPSFLASTFSGATQILDMNWKMIKDPFRFGHDMLRPIDRQEFVRGIRLKNFPSTRSYLLALGSFVPIAALGLAGIANMFSSKKSPDKSNTNNEFDLGVNNILSPKKSEESAVKWNLAETFATNMNKQSSEVENSDEDEYGGPFELAANVSAILPAVANIIYANVIKQAGFGNPFNILPPGTGIQHLITPRLNGNLVSWGSMASIPVTAVSALSTMGILPAGLSAVADPVYMGLQGLVGIGQVRNQFEVEFNPSQSLHFFPKPTVNKHMRDLAEARNTPAPWLFRLFGYKTLADLYPKNRIMRLDKGHTLKAA